jgi:hypothetical protein
VQVVDLDLLQQDGLAVLQEQHLLVQEALVDLQLLKAPEAVVEEVVVPLTTHQFLVVVVVPVLSSLHTLPK